MTPKIGIRMQGTEYFFPHTHNVAFGIIQDAPNKYISSLVFGRVYQSISGFPDEESCNND